jgi:pyruvate kinase
MPGKVVIKKSKPLDHPKTSIIATIGGPNIYSRDYIRSLIDEGMDIARINLSHIEDFKNPESASYRLYQTIITDIQEISDEIKRPIGILFDLCGPKIRVGNLPEPIPIETGNPDKNTITFTTNPRCYTRDNCSVTYSRFVEDVKEREILYLDDGKIELQCIGKNIEKNQLTCKIIWTSVNAIEANKGFNLPNSNVSEETLTRVDRRVLDILEAKGIPKNIDFLALSFVREPEDIRPLRNITNGFDSPKPLIIAKIETRQAVKRTKKGKYLVLDDFIRIFDGIMVARGDLATETKPQDVPHIQLYLTRKGIEQGKPVIIATQMLVSMTEEGHMTPTRAEANDVATAVLNNCDATMLSEETAKGANPSLCVKTMKEIALATEKEQGSEDKSLTYSNWLIRQDKTPEKRSKSAGSLLRQQAVAESAILLADNLGSPAIVVSTSSGDTAMKIAKYRPTQPIIAITDREDSANKMLLYRGIYPVLVKKKPENWEEIVEGAKEIVGVMLKNSKTIQLKKEGKTFIPLTLGIEPGIANSVATSGNTNAIYLLELK